MPKREYRSGIRFSAAQLEVIDKANEIAEAYAEGGDSLSLRQLYYQFVQRNLIKNEDREYKRLGALINNARYAGLFDWRRITDRTRFIRGGDGQDDDPATVVQDLSFFASMWEGQRYRVEVWVEKDALIEVVGRAADPRRTPYFSCRGYTSASEVWAAARRIEGYLDIKEVEHVVLLHLGDHDPSGIDMTRDITDRLREFLAGDDYEPGDLTVHRIALNMPQIIEKGPPPNPAKVTDSRAKGYIREFGTESWELDALDPAYLRRLIEMHISRYIDTGPWKDRLAFERDGQATLNAFADHYSEIHDFLAANNLLELPPETEGD